ncbi:hypothetical protein PORY_001905 [Pneumocystis oryctolagi]|uniref:Uncharacterized protein n=1 Tax=Pneumocystis oryctolagi TaxID=42067 RepID=A0ACB7CCR2_9ASCO|nr:hypothetical protein PORY_001905 [Pneumocystis oryctolagi]
MFQRVQKKHDQKFICSFSGLHAPKISNFKQTTLQQVANGTPNCMVSEPLKPIDASSLNVRSISVTYEQNSTSNKTYTKKNQKPSSSSMKFLETLSQNKISSANNSLHDINNENIVDGVYIDENDIDDNLNLESEQDESFYSWPSSSQEYQHSALSRLEHLPDGYQTSNVASQYELSDMALCENASYKTQSSSSSLKVDSEKLKDSLEDIDLRTQGFFDKQKHMLHASISEVRPTLQMDEKNRPFYNLERIRSLDRSKHFVTKTRSEMRNCKRIISNILSNLDAYDIDNAQICKSEIMDTQRKSVEKNINKKLPGLFLSEEQKTVLKIVVEERKINVLGTGKSILLREIITSLRKKYAKEPDRVAITASTGLAACNIGGVTLHSYAGIGLGRDSSEDLCKKIKKNKKCLSRWLRTKVLVIDEISMVDAELFDKLENIARKLRNNENPFGGIQKDQDFVEMLNELRLGHLSHSSIKKFCSLDRELQFDDGLEPTELFPTRNEVDKANATRMRALSGTLRTFEALDSGTVDKVQRDKLLSNCMAPARIDLKEGAQVMLIKNFDDQLVNGSLGKVIGFMNEKTFQIWQEDEPDDDPFNYHEQIDDSNIDEIKRRKKRRIAKIQSAAATGKLWPLVRFTLSNGLTRDIYVALSRATSQKGLQVLHFEARKVMAHPKVSLFYKSLVNTVDLKKKVSWYLVQVFLEVDLDVLENDIIFARIKYSELFCFQVIFVLKKTIMMISLKRSYGSFILRKEFFIHSNFPVVQKCLPHLFWKFQYYDQIRSYSYLNQAFKNKNSFKGNMFLKKIKKFTYILVTLGVISFAYDSYKFHHPTPLINPDPNKKTIVILGSGWGSISLLKNIRSDDYNIVVVSPRNYFLFTPLLPSCTTGTVEFRSIIEPIIYLIRRKKASVRFYEASCTSIDPNNKTIVIRDSSDIQSDVVETKLSYDYLVIGVGAENQTFGISGVAQYANFLKEVSDARKIRAKIMECIKTALFEGQTDEEKQRLLNMVVVGGGPTGIEFAAELQDFFETDLKKWYPEISNIFKVKLIEALPSVLPMFSKVLVNYTEAAFKKENIEIFTKSIVKGVTDKYISVETTTIDNEKVIRMIPYGLLVWAAGNTPRDVVKDLISKIPEQNGSSRGLMVNDYLSVKGTMNIWALGDCTATEYASTAQVASQQGQYLAKLFDTLSKFRKIKKEIQYLEKLLKIDNIDPEKEKIIKNDIDIKTKKIKRLSIMPFEFSYRGSLAYIGNDKAIADLSFMNGNFSMFGTFTFLFWRSVYASMLFSLRSRILVCLDWIKAFVFGRDISRF